LSKNYPITLTIAGSDSGGGAGIQADLKTFHQHKCFGTTVITSITAQNTTGVRAIQHVQPSVIQAQFQALLDDLAPKAMKTGMLGTSETIETIVRVIRENQINTKFLSDESYFHIPLIIDPVMVASSGDSLLEQTAESSLNQYLLPLAACLTPNLPEAVKLYGKQIESIPEMKEAAKFLADKYSAWVLLKGGHFDPTNSLLINVLASPYFDHIHHIEQKRIQTNSTHGTGCTLSAALTALVAHDQYIDHDSFPKLVEQALTFVHTAISFARPLGKGISPVNHHVSI
jgi:hydroxymethylpyrimidine/phosphomethylpyrimidine kinase